MSQRILRYNMRQSAYTGLRITMDSIDHHVELVYRMLGWFSLNGDVQSFVNATDRYPDDLRFKSIATFNVMRSSVYGAGLSDYVNKVLISNTSGDSVQFGLVGGHGSDYAEAMTLALSDTKNLVREPYHYSTDQLVLPIHLPIAGGSGAGQGHIVLTLNTDIITRFTSASQTSRDTRLFMSIGDDVFEVSGSELRPTDLFAIKDVESAFFVESGKGAWLQRQQDIPMFSAMVENDQRHFIVYRGPVSGWLLIRSVPEQFAAWPSGVYARLTMFVFIMVLFLAVVITLIVDRTVSRPVHNVHGRILRIAEGDFSVDHSIEYQNEIGDIGRGINHMVSEIDGLIQNRIQDEKTKKDLEFRVLQNQINPHFLYNTLNSIKWMATIQKTTGIAEMVSSLAVLLKHIAQGTDQMISLEDELSLVQEYCTIQSYRSGGIFTTDIQVEPELLNARVTKFVLQPLVENAVVHGIEPQGSPGRISISALLSEEGYLMLSVTDDGVGIPEGHMDDLLNRNAGSSDSLNHIGLRNVDERIKLSFGEPFGIKVQSREGEFTTVTLVLPYLESDDA